MILLLGIPHQAPAAGAAAFDAASVAGRPVTLAELFTSIELQTGLAIDYEIGEIPLGAEVTLTGGPGVTLAQILDQVSATHGLRCRIGGRELRIERASRPRPLPSVDPTLPALAAAQPAPVSRRGSPPAAGYLAAPVAPPPSPAAPAAAATPPRAAPRSAPGEAESIAAAVAEINRSTGVSGAAKERRISGLVRAAVTSATAGTTAREEIVGIAVAIAEAAAGAAPRYVEAIASAAAYTPAVTRIDRGAGRIRSAAYAAARRTGS